MATNKYFKNFSYGREQDLVEDLVIESIKTYGHDVRYIPRTLVNKDNLFGEDTLSQFNAAAEIEVYIKNVEGFEGDGDFLSKFNLEIRDQITLTMARKRFDQIKTEKLLTEVGYNLVFESGNNKTPSRQFLSQTPVYDNIVLETATAEGYAITSNRPNEGDLIFFPLTQKLYEIKFVEHEAVFYQTGRLQTYDIKCELFQYSSQQINTGNTVIDAIESEYSLDVLGQQFLLENGDTLLLEEGGSILQEYRVETQDRSANNEFYQMQADSIIDFSESNPFSEMDRY